MKKTILPAMVILLFALPASAGSNGVSTIEALRPIYIATGIPVDGTAVSSTTSDVKFQLSFALPIVSDIAGVEGLDFKIGYTQRSVWFLYAKSSPFKDNIYIPGGYLDIPLKRGDSLMCGIEHRSNGRDDSFSRSVNYVFGEYSHRFPFGLTVQANARAGFGWYDDDLTEKIFSCFYGYLTLGGMYEAGRFSALLSITPVFGNPAIMNLTAEIAIRLGGKNSMYNLFVQGHRGYDESMCDCIYGTMPPACLRFGVLITPGNCSRLSL